MKKKLLSLLLVIAVMMTSVSIGFGSIVASAGAAGGGVEGINAFSLVQNSNPTGTSFSTSITIKSKASGYQIKVNSISAVIRFTQDESSTIATVNVDSSAIGKVIGTGGQNFNVTGTIGAGLAGLIRYECNYDLLDSNGTVKYAGMTGYGYGVVSANGQQTGALGTNSSEPSKPGDRYYFGHFDSINSLYVQTPSIVLTSNQETSSNAIAGASSVDKYFTIEGTAPNTITLRNLHWDYVEMYGSGDVTTTWFEMNSMPNGYFNFKLYYDGSLHQNVEMYYRADAQKNAAQNILNQYLGEGREKSYYTADSWNSYRDILEYTAICAMAIPGPNNAFKVACNYVDQAAAGELMAQAKAGLSPVKADYTALNEAYNAFAAVKDNTVTVRTYDGGTSLGSTTLRLYVQSSTDAVVNYKNSCNMNLYRYDQPTVDNYTATIKSMVANLTYSDAIYTYLDLAISEHAGKKSSDYTNTTWAAYDGAVNNAKALSRSLKANEQSKINEALNAIVSAKINLKYVQANTIALNEQIEAADSIYTEYDSGKLLTAMEGFDEAWTAFEAAYKQANAVKGYTIDKQAEVDAATDKLAETAGILANYRLLDTTELQKVLAKTPEYEQSKYVAESYNAWSSLRVEGYTFLAKSQANYTGADRKTYAHLNEMNRLIKLINDAYEGLEKVKADFTALNAVVEQIPAEEVLALYKPEIVEAIKNVVATIDYGTTFDKQDVVDGITADLTAALAMLTEENYRDADYSKVEDAIADAGKYNRNEYTNFSIVDDAINAVVYGKKIVEQETVDGYATAIREAIKNLEYVLADYTEVNKAIEEAEAVVGKDNYANYYRVEEAIAAVDWNVRLNDQKIVDGYAAAIREAISSLTLAEADYSGVRAAIEEAEALEPLSDFNKDFIDALDLAISKVEAGYTKDRQAEVDAMEAEIRAVLATAEENLLPADYTKVNVAIAFAEGHVESEYSNYQIVKDAINAVNWDLNCRQTTEMQAQIDAIYAAVEALKLLPADYSKVEEAINNARYAYNNGAYPYTQESIDKVENAISAVNWDLDIQHQAEVNEFIVAINVAVQGLTYVRADYTKLDNALITYNNIQRDLYASLATVDAYVAALNMNITIDRQAEVDAAADELLELIENLEYAPADYKAVNAAISQFSQMPIDHYDEDQHKAVQELINNINWDLKKNNQADVDQIAEELRLAIAALEATLKKADLTALKEAKAAAQVKYSEMMATGYQLDQATVNALTTAIGKAANYNDETSIRLQNAIDAVTAEIIAAAENLEFVFTIDLEGTDLVIANGYIYGFEEGVMAEDARELIKFVGAAELKIYETRNGFGTGTMIQFVSTKTGEILCTYTVLVFGDANGDAVIDTYDVAHITEVVNSGYDPSVLELKVLDLFKDGYIDAMDVSIMISLANMDATLKQDGSMGTY